eukprot:5406545-Alexandrium_andersonii.AAC.1
MADRRRSPASALLLVRGLLVGRRARWGLWDYCIWCCAAGAPAAAPGWGALPSAAAAPAVAPTVAPTVASSVALPAGPQLR